MEGLIDTRNEYIEHIQDILSVAISKRIYAIYTEMIEEKKGLKGFQNELYSIRKWNNNMVNDEYKKIVKYTKCKYLSNLIKIIIITTIKIKIYEYREQFDNIKIKIPNPEDFVHKCYINAASFSWKNAYLYNRNNIKDAEYQNNLNIIEENIRAIIKKTFRDFVPFDEIFKQIEDNLTENVNQFKDNDEELIVNNEKETNEAKKLKKTTKVIDVDQCKEEEEEDEDDQDDEDAEEDDQDDEEEDDQDDEEDEDDQDDEEDEEEDDQDDEEDEEDEEDDEDVEGDQDKQEVHDDHEHKHDDHEHKHDDHEHKHEDHEHKHEDEENGCDTINFAVKIKDKDTEDNKIDNKIDTSLTKYNNEQEYKEGGKKEESIQEISFTKREQTNTQTKKDIDEKEKDDIHNVWDNIKDEYNSLSESKVDYKKYENEINEIVSKKYADVDDDAKSVSSVLSNFTDISQIKKIHISETTSKNRKPSFF